jgi:predicted kinase
LILIAGLPGVGKTTLAREFARQTRGMHYELDYIRLAFVPEDRRTGGIIPPEYRFQHYSWAIRKLPDFFAISASQIVIMDEPFHLQAFRRMWDESAKKLGIRLHWVEAVCDREIAKVRLSIRKVRENILAGKDSLIMFLLFEKAFEPLADLHEIVNTSKDIFPQVQRIVKQRSILPAGPGTTAEQPNNRGVRK